MASRNALIKLDAMLQKTFSDLYEEVHSPTHLETDDELCPYLADLNAARSSGPVGVASKTRRRKRSTSVLSATPRRQRRSESVASETPHNSETPRQAKTRAKATPSRRRKQPSSSEEDSPRDSEDDESSITGSVARNRNRRSIAASRSNVLRDLQEESDDESQRGTVDDFGDSMDSSADSEPEAIRARTKHKMQPPRIGSRRTQKSLLDSSSSESD